MSNKIYTHVYNLTKNFRVEKISFEIEDHPGYEPEKLTKVEVYVGAKKCGQLDKNDKSMRFLKGTYYELKC